MVQVVNPLENHKSILFYFHLQLSQRWVIINYYLAPSLIFLFSFTICHKLGIVIIIIIRIKNKFPHSKVYSLYDHTFFSIHINVAT